MNKLVLHVSLCFVFMTMTLCTFAQLDNFLVIRVDDQGERYEVTEDLQLADTDNLSKATGIGLGWDWVAEDAPEAKDKDVSEAKDKDVSDKITEALELKENQFYVGEYAIMCFDAYSDMLVRLYDSKPTGVTTQLYPRPDENGQYPAVEVEGGYKYCIGDSNSDVRLYADEKSGLGKGILYFIGVENFEDFPDVSKLGDIPPGWEELGLGWDWAVEDVDAGEVKVEGDNGDFYELHFPYEILAIDN